MTKEEQKKIRRKINILLVLSIVLVAAILILGIITGIMSIAAFLIIITVFLLAYWWVLNFLEPKLTGELEGITPEQKASRKKYVITDLIGYLGLILFLASMNLPGIEDLGTMGLVVFALGINFKQKFRREFFQLGKKPQKGAKTHITVTPPVEETGSEAKEEAEEKIEEHND